MGHYHRGNGGDRCGYGRFSFITLFLELFTFYYIVFTPFLNEHHTTLLNKLGFHNFNRGKQYDIWGLSMVVGTLGSPFEVGLGPYTRYLGGVYKCFFHGRVQGRRLVIHFP